MPNPRTRDYTRQRLLARTLAVVSLATACAAAEPGNAPRYPEGGPTLPSHAAAKIEVHPEFHLSLVAAEPLIDKVINLDWDERGRLWVCETPAHPDDRRLPDTAPGKVTGSPRATQPQRIPEDRISILTDTDGDGVMDRKHVFADKLERVTGFVFYKSGAIAASPPDIWSLEDTDGDGLADQRTKLYTGLGISDPPAVINHLRWGLDGWIYATHGNSSGDVSALGTPPSDADKAGGPSPSRLTLSPILRPPEAPVRAPAAAPAPPPPTRIGSGVVRFKPDGTAFEQYISRSGNTWGLDTTWDGQIFWTQPANDTVLLHALLPDRVLARGQYPGTTSWKEMSPIHASSPAPASPGQLSVQLDHAGRFPAAAGCALYEGGAWPEKWHYSYFTTEPTSNLVHHQFVRPDGVSYTTTKEPGREEVAFLRSRDPWFLPIATRIGPDGALYVIDFCEQAITHHDPRGSQQTPPNTAIPPDRDHSFARIWRVQHKEAKPLPVPTLDRRDLAALIRVLETSPNAHVKQTAWRLVLENHGAVGARALASVRRPPLGSRAEQRYHSARAATSLLPRQAVLADFAAASDPWTKSALIAAAAEHPADYITLSLNSPHAPALVAFVSALLPGVTVDRAPQLVQACANAPFGAHALKATLLRGLAQLPRVPTFLDAATNRLLQRLIQNPDTVAAALPLVARWDKTGALTTAAEPAIRQMLRDLVDRAQTDARRADLAAGLLALLKSRPDALKVIGELLVDPLASAPLQAALLAALGEAPGADTTALLIATLARTKSTAIFDQLLRRPASSLALLAAIKSGQVSAADLGPENIARLRAHPDHAVARETAATLKP